jgi:signal transduction histidine kinase
MAEPVETYGNLAALLSCHGKEIVTTWAELLHGLPASVYRERPLEELRASTMRMLEGIIETLSTGSFASLKELLAESSVVRLEMGFRIGKALEALMLFKEATHDVIWRAYPSGSPELERSLRHMDALLRRAVCESAGLYAAQATRHLLEQQGRTALMLEAIRTASSTLDLDQVFRRVSRVMATSVGVQHCGFYLWDEERKLLVPQIGTDELPTPAGAQVFLSWHVDPRTNAFTRQVLETQEPLACFDALADPRIDKEAARLLGVKSVLAVPFVVKDRVVALAIICTFEEHRVFSEAQVALVKGMADAVALAIENARLYQQVRTLATLQERDRLARELHDRLAQALGYVNMKASLTADLLGSGQVERARASLLEMKELVKGSYTDVRESIFGLRATAASGPGFLPTLEEYLAEYRTHYGVDARLVVDEASPPELSAEVGLQVTRIIQEALTNVRKHAQASKAWVRARRKDGWVRISIEDNGQGFDPDQVAREAGGTLGLQIMRERAESVGGTLRLDAQPGRGTRIVIQAPVRAQS